MNFYPNMPIPNMMPFNNMINPTTLNNDMNYMNDIFNKFNDFESRIKKLEQRITKLENSKYNNNYLDNDNSLYML